MKGILICLFNLLFLELFSLRLYLIEDVSPTPALIIYSLKLQITVLRAKLKINISCEFHLFSRSICLGFLSRTYFKNLFLLHQVHIEMTWKIRRFLMAIIICIYKYIIF